MSGGFTAVMTHLDTLGRQREPEPKPSTTGLDRLRSEILDAVRRAVEHGVRPRSVVVMLKEELKSLRQDCHSAFASEAALALEARGKRKGR
jgi:hypothetical protein